MSKIVKISGKTYRRDLWSEAFQAEKSEKSMLSSSLYNKKGSTAYFYLAFHEYNQYRSVYCGYSELRYCFAYLHQQTQQQAIVPSTSP